MYVVPAVVTTNRALRVGGVTIPAGTQLRDEHLDAIKNIQPLFANGSIVTSPDPYYRKTRTGNPEPTYISPSAYKTMRLALTEVPDPEE